MTAIAGFWSFSHSVDPMASCRRMLTSLQIYAPDPAAYASLGDLCLGRRLFRLLPEDRHDRAPARSADGRWTVVGDVRLDNREELYRRLKIPASTPLSDTALLAEALALWEEEAVDRLLGDFAFGAWDSSRERLLLARDFLGQRPLHFHRGSGFFAFASMPKGLQALPEIPSGPDEETVTKFLALFPETGTRTFFKGIERVPPGHFCLVDASGQSLKRYWNPTPEPLRLSTHEEYCEVLRAEFDRSVAVRLRGCQGHVASHLSSGLDSSTVAATAARLLSPAGRVTAFTSVPREGYETRMPRGRFADEGPLAAEVAAAYPNMEHVLVRGAGKSPLADLDRNFYLYDRPILNAVIHVSTEAIMAAAKQRGLSILLTGSTGNMSFSYSGLELLPGLLRSGRLLRLAKEAYLLRRNGSSLESIAAHAVGPHLPASVWGIVNRWRGRGTKVSDYSAIAPELAEALKRDAVQARLDFSYRPRSDPLETRLWVLARSDSGNYNKGYLGGWGIDARDPTADRRLVELCLSIPTDQYLSNGRPRALARAAFSDRLPARLLQETGSGYQVADWHEGLTNGRGEAAAELARIRGSDSAAGALDTAMLEKLIAHWPDKDWNSWDIQGRYRIALVRGLTAGHFIRKAEGSNR